MLLCCSNGVLSTNSSGSKWIQSHFPQCLLLQVRPHTQWLYLPHAQPWPAWTARHPPPSTCRRVVSAAHTEPALNRRQRRRLHLSPGAVAADADYALFKVHAGDGGANRVAGVQLSAGLVSAAAGPELVRNPDGIYTEATSPGL